MATGVAQYLKSRRVFPVLVAMEMLDRDACERVAEKIGGAPIFASDQLNMYEIVSMLRECDRMLSSRFHAIVTSMPAGVPSAGVTMDERIRNLMRERGHDHLLMKVDEPELADKIVVALGALDAEADEIRHAMGRVVARNLQLMARMGVYFEEHVARQYPEFPDSRQACWAGKSTCRRSAPCCANCSKSTAECSRHDIPREHLRAPRTGVERPGASRDSRRAHSYPSLAASSSQASAKHEHSSPRAV